MNTVEESVLVELLLQWEEQYKAGQDTSPATLCRNHPGLVAELGRRIAVLKGMAWLNETISPSDSDTDRLPISTVRIRSLAKRYRLDSPLGGGGFAEVWRGFDSKLQRTVAIKLPKLGRIGSADSFMVEAQRVARLKHPGIVPVFDAEREDGHCFIVSEFIEGGSLGCRLARTRPSLEQSIEWVVQVAEALDFAHNQGIVHRDVKPANILLDHHGRALLIDFGIAVSASGGPTVPIGSPPYMSPEQIEGLQLDRRSDVFSLGLVFHELVTGKLPYSTREQVPLRREILHGITKCSSGMPAGLRPIFLRAVERHPRDRYASAVEFASALKQFSARPRRTWFPIGVSAALVLLAGGTAIWWGSQPEIELGPGEPVAEASASEPPMAETPTSIPEAPEPASPGPETRSPIPAPSKPTSTIAELLGLGQKHLEQGRFEKADEHFTQAIALDPTNAEAFDGRGASRFNAGRGKDSLADFDRAIALNADNPEFYKHRAAAYGAIQNLDEGIADGEKALSLKPNDTASYHDVLARLYSNRAGGHAMAERFTAAIADMTEAIKHDPRPAMYYHQRASCFFNSRQFEKAAADFTEAIQREPNKADHYMNRGQCWQALGKPKEASADLDMAKKLRDR